MVFLLCLSLTRTEGSSDLSKHVVVVVWDGMRPDFVTASNTPALFELARRGVFFKSNHSVYLSSTEVNGTALATGAYPQHNGIIGNKEFRPDIDLLRPIATESLTAMRKGDEHGSYLNVATLAEILHAHGVRTAITGSKPVVLLQDRAARSDDATNVLVYEGRTLPAAKLPEFQGVLGPFPGTADTKTNRDLWTTRALIGPLWEKDVPGFSLLWLAEPDNVQHATGVGSRRAIAAIRNSDHALSLVLEALKAKGVYDSTDILVASDHGFSTITRNVDIAAQLSQAGFNSSREFKSKPTKGDVLVIGLGGSALLYVAGHEEQTIAWLVNYLQQQEYVGVIFTQHAREGTFALDAGMIQSAHAPDVAFSFRWMNVTNANGAPGELISDGQGTSNPTAGPGLKGTHVSLSRFDLNNVLVAAGPDFRQGLISKTPSGNVDVAPTILHLLGIKPPVSMDGRVLFEALKSTDARPPKISQRELTASAKQPNGLWTQHLSTSEVNGVRYLDEGNGEFVTTR